MRKVTKEQHSIQLFKIIVPRKKISVLKIAIENFKQDFSKIISFLLFFGYFGGLHFQHAFSLSFGTWASKVPTGQVSYKILRRVEFLESFKAELCITYYYIIIFRGILRQSWYFATQSITIWFEPVEGELAEWELVECELVESIL